MEIIESTIEISESSCLPLTSLLTTDKVKLTLCNLVLRLLWVKRMFQATIPSPTIPLEVMREADT